MNRRYKLFTYTSSLKTQKGEIDLRRELEIIFDFEKRSKWYVYRRKDLTKKTDGFIDFMNENPNGPDFEYIDELHRGFKIPQGSLSTMRRVDPTLQFGEPFQLMTFFVFKYKSEYNGKEYYLDPKPDDLLFELDYHEDIAPDIIDREYFNGYYGQAAPPFLRCYNIRNILELDLDDNSRIEYYILACTANPIKNK